MVVLLNSMVNRLSDSVLRIVGLCWMNVILENIECSVIGLWVGGVLCSGIVLFSIVVFVNVVMFVLNVMGVLIL